mmetsp:Transcript_120028/g.233737  ORF Transcript_120028/g.233737 Transcript_120028/m.233737 type:complete len:210 (+) Transcript_120028:827-1456(+)
MPMVLATIALVRPTMVALATHGQLLPTFPPPVVAAHLPRTLALLATPALMLDSQRMGGQRGLPSLEAALASRQTANWMLHHLSPLQKLASQVMEASNYLPAHLVVGSMLLTRGQLAWEPLRQHQQIQHHGHPTRQHKALRWVLQRKHLHQLLVEPVAPETHRVVELGPLHLGMCSFPRTAAAFQRRHLCKAFKSWVLRHFRLIHRWSRL